MLRHISAVLVVMLMIPACLVAQVDIADRGESGFGALGNFAATSGTSGLGGFFSFTGVGVVDFGMGFVSLDRRTYTTGQITALPIQTRDQNNARWSLGGLVRYESADGVTGVGGGPVLTLDVMLSPKTDFQLGGSLAFLSVEGADDLLTSYSVMGGFIFKGKGANFFVMSGASIPTDGDFTTFNVQVGLFLKTDARRKARPEDFGS